MSEVFKSLQIREHICWILVLNSDDQGRAFLSRIPCKLYALIRSVEMLLVIWCYFRIIGYFCAAFNITFLVILRAWENTLVWSTSVYEINLLRNMWGGRKKGICLRENMGETNETWFFFGGGQAQLDVVRACSWLCVQRSLLTGLRGHLECWGLKLDWWCARCLISGTISGWENTLKVFLKSIKDQSIPSWYLLFIQT